MTQPPRDASPPQNALPTPVDDAAATDPSLALGEVWELLDVLPAAAASPDMMATTIEMAAVPAGEMISRTGSGATTARSGRPAEAAAWPPVRQWLPGAAIVLASLLAGIAVGRATVPTPETTILACLPVVQHLDLLREAGSVGFLEAVAKSVDESEVRLYGLQGEIDRINREITALGPVNLAALEELSTSRERKTFLDSQNADLTEAMNTLEDAIKKIDAETRDLLGGTFKIVNEHFSRMFPELFGGGQAKLVMTGEEILDSGVQVMAQPPGKKNQTIHLLSGGEKALTAIALVFAIFQLNPAPFCLLDEVDAPLDDANTERYAKLVASMGKETQFLFISHNKIAMEMAKQLIGVTMQEQGVSRIVAVDMESAVNLAQI